MTWLNVWIKKTLPCLFYYQCEGFKSNLLARDHGSLYSTDCNVLLFHAFLQIHPFRTKFIAEKRGCLSFFLTNLTNTLKSRNQVKVRDKFPIQGVRNLCTTCFPFASVWHEWPSFLLRIRNNLQIHWWISWSGLNSLGGSRVSISGTMHDAFVFD